MDNQVSHLSVSPSPHIRSASTTTKVMGTVIIALLPALVASVVIFGPRALLVTAVTVAAAVLFGYLDGELEHGSIEQFYRNVDTVGGDKNFKARVDVLMVEETLAVARVLEEGWGGRVDFTDVLLMLKMNGEWKCVAKAYNQNSNTIK